MPDQGSIVKASAALRRDSTAVLSRRSGLPQSRIARIFAGRAAPTEREFIRLLRACGSDPASLLTSIGKWKRRCLGKGTACTPQVGDDHLLILLLVLLRGSTPCEVGEDYLLTVDRLSFTFSVDDEDEFLRLLQQDGDHVGGNKLYDCVFRRGRFSDGVHRLQIDHGLRKSRGRSSRIDFIRGDSLTEDSLRADRTFLCALSKTIDNSSWRVSRVDVAIDAPFSIHHVQALGSSRQKVLRWIGPHGVETITYGTRRSERQIQLYDKRQQLIDEGRADEDHPQLTRIEARLSNVGGSLHALPALKDPFQSLAMLCLAVDGSLIDVLLAGYASFVGITGLRDAVDRSLLPKATFNELMARAASRSKEVGVVHPTAVFESKWKQHAEALVLRLQKLGIGGGR